MENVPIQFFLHMIPPTVTNQEHRIGKTTNKVYLYDSPEIKDAKQKFNAYLSKHIPDEPIKNKPIRLTVKWLFPRGNHQDGEYKTTKPDTDNLQKMLKDCMTKLGYWKDDALVASEIIEKFWAEYPGIYIRIEEL